MGTSKQKKKILIYTPYWKMLGGGERYLLDIARALKDKYGVYIVADKNLAKHARVTFGINLDEVVFLDPKFFTGRKFFSRYFFIRQFDICFYTTDGSLFFPAAGKNYLIIQSPAHIPSPSLANVLKLKNWNIVCYSAFMGEIIRRRLKRDSIVLPPAVDTSQYADISGSSVKKEKIFLTVGRFFTSRLHEKKTEFLLEFFRKNFKKHFPQWKLIICGNLTEKSGLKNVKSLRKLIAFLPVELHINLPFSKLIKIYSRASIYWHAAGVGVDPLQFPEKMEHFGITTIEAMAAGCVPVVFAAGGQKDIVENKKSGYLWSNEQEFLKANLKIANNPKLLKSIGKNAVRRAACFSRYEFKKRLHELV